MDESIIFYKIFPVVILIGSIILHEISHGVAALWCGDTTAKEAGRLSLNPIKHVDIFGSIILPAILVISNAGFWIGWAKPVPVNLGKCRNPRAAMWITALAGPLTNIILAIVSFALYILVLFLLENEYVTVSEQAIQAITYALEFLQCGLLINAGLAFFNLCPIPPLDGSKIVASVMPVPLMMRYLALERFGFIIIIILVKFDVFSWYIGGLMNGTINIANSIIAMLFG